MAPPIIPAGSPVAVVHPPARCSLIDSPTATQRESEVQLTAVSGCGAPTVDGAFHGWPGAPVTMTRPAWGDVATELPTVTHVPMAVHEMPLSEADRDVTVWLDQVAPPLAVVRMSPCPALAASRMVAVVPTTVQRAPGIPTMGAVVVVDAGGTVVVVVGAVLVVVGTGRAGGDGRSRSRGRWGRGRCRRGNGDGAASGRRSVDARDAVERAGARRRGHRGPVGSAVGGEGQCPGHVVESHRGVTGDPAALVAGAGEGAGPGHGGRQGSRRHPGCPRSGRHQSHRAGGRGSDRHAPSRPGGRRRRSGRGRRPAPATWVHCAPPSAVEMITA